MKVTQEDDQSGIPKNGIDGISLAYFNAGLFETTQIIMLKETNQQTEQVIPYRLISLLLSIQKIFVKLLLGSFKPLSYIYR